MIGLHGICRGNQKSVRIFATATLAACLGLPTLLFPIHAIGQQEIPNSGKRGTVTTADLELRSATSYDDELSDLFMNEVDMSLLPNASVPETPASSARFEKLRPTKPLPRLNAVHDPQQSSARPIFSGVVEQSTFRQSSADSITVKSWFVQPSRLTELTGHLQSVYGNKSNISIAADSRDSKVLIMASAEGHASTGKFLTSQGFAPADDSTINPYLEETFQSRDFQLKNLDWRDLESIAAKIWQDKAAIRASKDGLVSTFNWPVSATQKCQIRIDRTTNNVKFEGSAEYVARWNRSLQMLDSQAGSGKTLESVMVTPKQQGLVSRALTMFQVVSLEATQKQGVANALWETTGDLPWGGRVASNMFGPVQQTALNQNTQQGTGEQNAQRPSDEEILNQGKALSSDVQVEILPDGTVIVVGPPEDAREVTEMIRRLQEAAKANAPKVEVYPLQNVEGATIQPVVQDIYDRSYQPRLGDASATNLGKPNAIMIVGSEESVSAMKELLEKLDVKSDPTDTFRVFRIKNMSVVDAANRLSSYFGVAPQSNNQGTQQVATDGVNAAPQLRIIPDYRSNTLIVQGSPQELEEAAEVIEAFDVESTGPEGARQEIKIFPLKNSIAGELAPVLQSALNGQLNGAGQGYLPQGAQQGTQITNQGNQQQANTIGSQIRSAMISLKLIDPTGETVTSTITFDVRVSADSNSNSLIVTAPSESMHLIELLIAQLDRLPNAESVVNIFKIVNGDATLLLETLQNLFTSQSGQGGFGQNQSTIGQLPLATGSGEVSLVGLQFAVDRRTNSIVAAGSRADMNVVEDVLSRLDEDQLVNRIHKVFRLQHVDAQLVADSITNWISTREGNDSADPTFQSEYQVGKRSLTVVAELESNSLIVSATPEYYELVRNIINDIDRRRRVMVQAVLANVALTKTDEFGIELGVQDSILFDRGLSPSANVIGFPFNQAALGNNLGAVGLATRETFAGQTLSNLSVGRSNGSVGYGGLVVSAGNESISVLMRALKDRGNTRILSRPQIMTLENLRGYTQVGQDIPSPSLSTNNATGTQTTYEYINTGIQLGVLPRVSPDGTIYMEVDVTNSSLAAGDGIPIQANSDGTVITAPIINQTTAQTTVTARSGQTIIIGGLITDSVSESRRGIPILSDIPAIGTLFRFDSKTNNRSELLIILRPIVVDDDETLAQLNQIEMDRMHWCYEDVVELHGPIDNSLLFDGCQTEVIYPDSNPSGAPAETTPYFTKEGSQINSEGQTTASGTNHPAQQPVRTSQRPAGKFTPGKSATNNLSTRRELENSSAN